MSSSLRLIFLTDPRMDKKTSTLSFEGNEHILTRLPLSAPVFMIASCPISILATIGLVFDFSSVCFIKVISFSSKYEILFPNFTISLMPRENLRVEYF